MRYEVDGIKLPSVTEVLKFGGLYGEYRNVSRETLERKAYLGNAVHLATHLYDEGSLDRATVAEQVAPYLDAWKSFVDLFGFETTRSEMFVYSKRHKFAGTLDRIGKVKGKTFLIDIKTTAGMNEKAVAMQTAGYKLAYEEMTGEHIDRRYAVQLKAGKFKLYGFEFNAIDENNFLELVEAYHEAEKNYKGEAK